MTAVSRRSLFTGGRKLGIRPPWAVAEDQFQDVCTQCDACIDACPTGLLVRDRAGFPIADFSNGSTCDFCGACAGECPRGALIHSANGQPWTVAARVAPSCLDQQGISCRACADTCEQSAIRFRPALGGVTLVSVDADRCNGCGACLSRCPVGALTIG